MRELSQKLSKTSCTNIISLLQIQTINPNNLSLYSIRHIPPIHSENKNKHHLNSYSLQSHTTCNQTIFERPIEIIRS